MAEIGYPVIGDSVYSNGKNELKVEGQCLHAQKLQFRHPITGKEMNLEAPLPEYFTKILEELENLYWRQKTEVGDRVISLKRLL